MVIYVGSKQNNLSCHQQTNCRCLKSKLDASQNIHNLFSWSFNNSDLCASCPYHLPSSHLWPPFCTSFPSPMSPSLPPTSSTPTSHHHPTSGLAYLPPAQRDSDIISFRVLCLQSLNPLNKRINKKQEKTRGFYFHTKQDVQVITNPLLTIMLTEPCMIKQRENIEIINIMYYWLYWTVLYILKVLYSDWQHCLKNQNLNNLNKIIVYKEFTKNNVMHFHFNMCEQV